MPDPMPNPRGVNSRGLPDPSNLGAAPFSSPKLLGSRRGCLTQVNNNNNNNNNNNYYYYMFFSIIIIFFFKSNNINEYNNIYNINNNVKLL